MNIKLNITNFNSFEKAISACTEPVFTLENNGEKKKITTYVLNELRKQYMSQKQSISIKCVCSPTSDYYHLLAAAVWE